MLIGIFLLGIGISAGKLNLMILLVQIPIGISDGRIGILTSWDFNWNLYQWKFQLGSLLLRLPVLLDWELYLVICPLPNTCTVQALTLVRAWYPSHDTY